MLKEDLEEDKIDLEFKSAEGKRVELEEDWNGIKKGTRGTIQHVKKINGMPKTIDVSFDGVLYSKEVPVGKKLLKELNVPRRGGIGISTLRSGAVVENGKEKEIPIGTESAGEDNLKPRHDNIDSNIFAFADEIMTERKASHKDFNKYVKEHDEIDKNFFDKVSNILKEHDYYVGMDWKKEIPEWEVNEGGDSFEIGGLSSNKLYAPNGGVDIMILNDEIGVKGHYDEVEYSHGRIFSIKHSDKALAFLKQVIDDVDNRVHMNMYF